MRGLISHGSTILVLLMALASCSAADSPSDQPLPAVDAPRDIEVRIMTFNIEWGGTHISFDNVAEAIRRSNADIVGIQEAEGNLVRLARALGWHYDRRNYIISRFPLLDPPGADGKYVLAEVSPGYVIAIANLHLPSDPYGPDLVRDGATLDEVLATEHAVRMPALQPYLEKLAALTGDGIPIFVTGDFNTPSHTDWTAAMAGKRPFLRYAVEWPVSLAMQQSGFHDSWRMLFPDVADKPGLTWWAGRPPLEAYAPDENDSRDRIDLIWYAGPAKPVSALLVGETGGPDVAISVDPWPSDHRAVVAQFSVNPVRLPILLTTDRRIYREGDVVTVTYNLAGEGRFEILLTDNRSDRPLLARQVSQASGNFELPAASAGRYLLETTVDQSVYDREFWVLKRDAAPFVEVNRANIEAGGSFEVRWRDAPGNRNDYLAIYAEDSRDAVVDMLAYAYIDAQPDGVLKSSAFIPAADWYLSSGTWHLSPGSYVAKLMEDDGYKVLAVSELLEVR